MGRNLDWRVTCGILQSYSPYLSGPYLRVVPYKHSAEFNEHYCVAAAAWMVHVLSHIELYEFITQASTSDLAKVSFQMKMPFKVGQCGR
jgi:hypothetical protein